MRGISVRAIAEGEMSKLPRDRTQAKQMLTMARIIIKKILVIAIIV
jgi:hypothetical protein